MLLVQAIIVVDIIVTIDDINIIIIHEVAVAMTSIRIRQPTIQLAEEEGALIDNTSDRTMIQLVQRKSLNKDDRET